MVQRCRQSYEKAAVNRCDFQLHLNMGFRYSLKMWWETVSAAGPEWIKLRSPNFVLVVRLIYLAISVDLSINGYQKRLTVHCPPDAVVLGWCGSDASANRVCTWSCLQLGTSWVASEQASRGLVDEGDAADELPRLEHTVAVLELYVVVQLAEHCNSLDAKRWTLRWAVIHIFVQSEFTL